MVNEVPYSKIDPRELKDLEAEFGRTLTPELAQCLIRFRINRDAIELMMRHESGAGSLSATGLSEMNAPKPETESTESADASSEEELNPARQPGRGARRTGSGAARKAVA